VTGCNQHHHIVLLHT